MGTPHTAVRRRRWFDRMWLRHVRIALTAPWRWLRGLLRSLRTLFSRRRAELPPRRRPGPPPAGVREPRRPHPPLDSGAMELPVPVD